MSERLLYGWLFFCIFAGTMAAIEAGTWSVER